MRIQIDCGSNLKLEICVSCCSGVIIYMWRFKVITVTR